MTVTLLDVEQFAADRGQRLEDFDAELAPVVTDALVLYPEDGWAEEIVEAASVLWLETYQAAGGEGDGEQALAAWAEQMTQALARTTTPADPPESEQVDRITYWVSTAAANGGTLAAADGSGGDLRWITRRDEAVRSTHRAADGQTRPVGEPFDIGGYPLHYPGEPVGPPEIYLGCRCLLYPATGAGPTMTARKGVAMTLTAPATDTDDPVDNPVDNAPPWDGDPDAPLPWHGVLAPEGVPTGDGRGFATDALTHRDLPLPLRYTPIDNGEHLGAVIVGNIQRIWREGDMVLGEGEFHDGPHATEAVDLISRGMLRGVSVDLDDVEIAYADTETEADLVTAGRISAATLVAIPAFAEAYVTLGTAAEAAEDLAASADCLPCQEVTVEEFVSDKPWSDFTEADYSADQWFEATCLHRNGDSRVKSDNGLPVREPDGTLNSNAVHAAAARFNQVEADADAKAAAARCLRGAYAELSETPPEVLTAAADTDDSVAVGVGDRVRWELTDDDGEISQHTGVVESITGETARVLADGEDGDVFEVPVADLQVVDAEPSEPAEGEPPFSEQFAPGTRDGPGWVTNPADSQRLRDYWARGEGAAKIRWTQPGDFDRCRRQLAKYIKNPQWLAGTCANLHRVATGVWPGQESASLAAGAAPMFNLVASVQTEAPADISVLAAPGSWFESPNLTQPTALKFEQDGPLIRVYGHLAAWGTCHTGVDGVCRTAPRSQANYAYFANGSYLTAEGQTIPVGRITLDTGHAGGKLAAGPTLAHYDNTGSVAAYVAAGEDEHGIWVSGVVAPWLESGALTRLRGAVLSGDWRMLRGNLELVAALAVNVPGFPVPHTSLAASGGQQISLVAAGIVAPPSEAAPLNLDDLADAVVDRLAARQDRQRKVRAAQSVFATIRAEKITAARALLKEEM